MEPNKDNWWSIIDRNDKAEVDFCHAVMNQDAEMARRGRLAVFNIGDQFENQNLVDGVMFQSLDDLEMLSQMRPALKIFQKQLIILEDLGKSWVELLGVTFGIPLLVFALHWADPTDHSTGNVQLPLGSDFENHHILNYREILPFTSPPNSDSQGSPHFLNTNAYRPITKRLRPAKVCGQFRTNATSEQLVTYYHNHEITILLVDSIPLDHNKAVFFNRGAESLMLSCQQTDPPRRPKLHIPDFGKFSRVDYKWKSTDTLVDFNVSELDADMKKLIRHTSGGVRPTSIMIRFSHNAYGNTFRTEFGIPGLGSSMFDELKMGDCLSIHQDPLSATSFVRRLVLAKTAVVMGVVLGDVVTLTMAASMSSEKITNFDFEKFEEKAWSDEWRGKLFTYLWELREDLDLLAMRMGQNLHTLQGVERLRPHASDRVSEPGLDTYLERVFERQFRLDLEEWSSLEKRRNYAFQILNRTTDSYLQTVQARASTLSNTVAKNSEKLAGLAAVFVPASLCAAVLAIPSFGTVDSNTRFYIFWGFSVPVATLLAIWLLSPLPEWIKKQLKIQQDNKDIIGDLASANRSSDTEKTTPTPQVKQHMSLREQMRQRILKPIEQSEENV